MRETAMASKETPFYFIRVAELDASGEPILEPGEGARQYRGKWYVVDEEISLEQAN